MEVQFFKKSQGFLIQGAGFDGIANVLAQYSAVFMISCLEEVVRGLVCHQGGSKSQGEVGTEEKQKILVCVA